VVTIDLHPLADEGARSVKPASPQPPLAASPFDAESRRFYSTVLLWLAPLALMFGWFFLMAGTGLALMLAGIALQAVAVAIAPSWRRGAAAAAGLVAGCWPLWYLIAWALTL
jgi:hypothetical protein